MIEAVLFDLDGTVADTNALIYASFQAMFTEKLGITVADETIYNFFGEPLEKTLRRYEEDPKDLLDFYRAHNLKHHDEMVTAFEGVEEALIHLKKKGLPLGIVTSKREEMARRSLSCLGLTKYFDVIVTPEYTKEHKPSKEPLLKACELLGGVDPTKTIMVGDAVYDILCGQGAGAYTAGVTYSKVSLDRLRALKPSYMLDDLRELLPIVDTLNAKA